MRKEGREEEGEFQDRCKYLKILISPILMVLGADPLGELGYPAPT